MDATSVTYDNTLFGYDLNTTNNDYTFMESQGSSLWITLFVLTAVASCITNGIVIAAICKKNYNKSAWDVLFIWYCVLNVCVSIDYIVIAIIYYEPHYWFLPDWMCPLYTFFSSFSRMSTYVTLAGLSFVNLVFYKDIGQRCLPFELLLVFASIFISTAFSVPVPIFSSLFNSVCIRNLGQTYDIVSIVFTMICPIFAAVSINFLFFIMKIATKKITKAIVLRVSITVIFVATCLPTWILTIMNYADVKMIELYNYVTIYNAFGWLICFGCFLSSVVYLALNQSARHSLCCCKQCFHSRYHLTDMVMEENVQESTTLHTRA